MGISRDKVLAYADAELIVRSLGYQLGRKTRNSIQMLCPFPDHADRKIGNCQLNLEKKLFHCFACNRGGTIIDLVMLHEGWDLSDRAKSYDAMEKIVEIQGLPEAAVDDGKGFVKKIIPPSLTREQESLIGLFNDPVYSPSNVEIDENGEMEETKSLVVSSPLTLLRTEEPDVYCELVLRHAEEVRKRLTTNCRSFLNIALGKRDRAALEFYEDALHELVQLDEIVIGILEYKSKVEKGRKTTKWKNK